MIENECIDLSVERLSGVAGSLTLVNGDNSALRFSDY